MNKNLALLAALAAALTSAIMAMPLAHAADGGSPVGIVRPADDDSASPGPSESSTDFPLYPMDPPSSPTDTSSVSPTDTPSITPLPLPRLSVMTTKVVESSGKLQTGGIAQLVGDAIKLNVTLAGATGPLGGFGDDISVDGATLQSVADNGDGTYTLAVTSNKPGTFTTQVIFGDQTVGSALDLAFIGGTVKTANPTAGETLKVTASGFMWSEPVTVTVHSDAIRIGSFQAEEDGHVTVYWVIPRSFVGDHTMTFSSPTSGKVDVPFTVQGMVSYTTGGSVAPPSALPPGLILMMGVGAAAMVVRMRRQLAA